LKTDAWTALQYRAGQAQRRAQDRAVESHRPWRLVDDEMVAWVCDGLRKGWSPQMICGRLRRLHPDDRSRWLSPETVYAWIYAPVNKERRLWEYLPRGRKKRRKRAGRRVHSSKIARRVSIRHRPKSVEDRSEFGHWEADTVIGVRGGQALHTEVERKTRFVEARKVEAVNCEQAVASQLSIFSPLPESARLTVTMDNGTEFHRHYEVADTLGIDTYFADPYSSWQRGTNEHFNGRIRRYTPKGTDFADINEGELQDIIDEINNQPRKCLDWATPAEAFTQHLHSTQTTTRCTSD
jgi:IS30 family transposase